MLFIATSPGMNHSSFNVTGKVVHSHSAYIYKWQGEVCAICVAVGEGLRMFSLEKYLELWPLPSVFLTKCSIHCSM